jgi:hypothetical protein
MKKTSNKDINNIVDVLNKDGSIKEDRYLVKLYDMNVFVDKETYDHIEMENKLRLKILKTINKI